MKTKRLRKPRKRHVAEKEKKVRVPDVVVHMVEDPFFANEAVGVYVTVVVPK